VTIEETALAARHRRLRTAAAAVVAEAKACGTEQHPLCGVDPHLIRRLRRELTNEPQPSMAWMSAS
jgi:hypothetical protein